jgi:hypothetical protein
MDAAFFNRPADLPECLDGLQYTRLGSKGFTLDQDAAAISDCQGELSESFP